jgi:outer membrane murein-binding lipoprotein Lpp
MKRLIAVTVIGVAMLAGCSSSSGSDPISDAFKGTATRQTCTEAFQKFAQDSEALDSATRNAAVKEFYTIAPLACPSREVWNDVGEAIAPGTVIDWSSESERTSVLAGQCESVEELGLKAPACE